MTFLSGITEIPSKIDCSGRSKNILKAGLPSSVVEELHIGYKQYSRIYNKLM